MALHSASPESQWNTLACRAEKSEHDLGRTQEEYKALLQEHNNLRAQQDDLYAQLEAVLPQQDHLDSEDTDSQVERLACYYIVFCTLLQGRHSASNTH